MILHIFILLGSFLLLAGAGKWMIDAMVRMGMCLKLKEFVLAFLVMGIGATLPNLIVGVISAFNNISELSFGDVVGSNIFDISLVVGLAALVSRAGISANSQTVQGSALFTSVVAFLPLLLIFDGQMSRIDGVLLLISFAIYIFWLFSKKDRFSKVYRGCPARFTILEITKDVFIILIGLAMLLLGGEGIIKSVEYFYQEFNLHFGLMGIFVVALGTSMPEAIFSFQAAKKGQDWMILGNIMGNVAVTSTFILGLVSLISPIKISGFSPFAIARGFLIIAIISFLFFTRTDQKITRKEGLFLVAIYIVFLVVEILVR